MNVKEARLNARYSQREVAEHLGVSRPTYIKMEQNPGTITMEDAHKLAEFFGMSVDDIVFFEPNCN